MEDLKVIMTFTYPHEAHVVKGYLEANGLEIFIKDELTVQVNNFYSKAIGGVKLLVENSNYEHCLKLLRDGGYLTHDDSSKKTRVITINAANDKKCPFCESDNIGRKNNVNILVLPIYLLLGIIFPIFRFTYICFDCEKEWKLKK